MTSSGWSPDARGQLAFSLGGMGSPTTNFYNDAYRRQGFADAAAAWRDAGVTTLRVYPAGETLEERLATLGWAVDVVNDLNREARSTSPR